MLVNKIRFLAAVADTGMNMTELLKKAGVSLSTASNIHAGKPIRAKTLHKLAVALNVDAIELLKEHA